MKSKKQLEQFIKEVEEMTDEELVSIFQYVGGLFARYQEQMHKATAEVARDLNIIKHELLKRLKNQSNLKKGNNT